MIKHIVLFKLQPFKTNDLKHNKLLEIKNGLESLKDKIDVLNTIEVGINSNPEENFDIALTTTFNTMADLESYAKHPDHLAVGKTLREVLESRSCVDYIV